MLEGKSMLAGIAIGLGMVANIAAPNPILGAFLFSLGLLVVIHMQLKLYTGQVGFYHKKGKGLARMLFFNWLGAQWMVVTYSTLSPEIKEKIQTLAENKFSKSAWVLFFAGLFCGILIHIAIKCKENNLITVLAVMTFILIGAEHCVADFPLIFFISPSWELIGKFILIILGNSLGAMSIEAYAQMAEDK